MDLNIQQRLIWRKTQTNKQVKSFGGCMFNPNRYIPRNTYYSLTLVPSYGLWN